jgi:hypothetical protein
MLEFPVLTLSLHLDSESINRNANKLKCVLYERGVKMPGLFRRQAHENLFPSAKTGQIWRPIITAAEIDHRPLQSNKRRISSGRAESIPAQKYIMVIPGSVVDK